jgi:hypothetical protein
LVDAPDRINARLDGESKRRLGELTGRTGHSVSHVVREALAVYHAQVIGAATAPSRLLAMAGKFHSGRSDGASNVRALVSEYVMHKHRGEHAPAQPAAAGKRRRAP